MQQSKHHKGKARSDYNARFANPDMRRRLQSMYRIDQPNTAFEDLLKRLDEAGAHAEEEEASQAVRENKRLAGPPQSVGGRPAEGIQEELHMAHEPLGIPAPSSTANHIEWPKVVANDAWREARNALLVKEKDLMKRGDALAAERRRLPMVEVPTDYRFLTADGETDLVGLFAGRRQLIAYRFFCAPDVENWPDGACSGCSMFADSVTHHEHLAARDVTLVFASAAPQDRINTYKRRMGWTTPWVTLPDDRFSRDFDVEEQFGINVFVRDGDRAYRTYLMNGRGVEAVGPTFTLLDLTPLGRQEGWQDVPPGRPQGAPYAWWRLHDHYGSASNPWLPIPS